MKKETRKKIINTSLIAALGAGAFTPVAIALGQKKDIANDELLNNTLSRSITPGTFGINGSSRFYMASGGNLPEGQSKLPIRSYGPNDYRAVPNGFVFRGDRYLACVDKNDPTKVLWYDDYGSQDILQIEYIPGADKLVVLYSVNKKTQGSGQVVKIGFYSNVSSLNGNASSALTERDINLPELTDNQRSDMFAFTPIIKPNVTTDEVWFYPKTYKGDNSGSLYNYSFIYNINTNNIHWINASNGGTFPFFYWGRSRYILSMGVAQKPADRPVYIISMASIIEDVNPVLEMYTYWQKEDGSWAWTGGDQNGTTQKSEWFKLLTQHGIPQSEFRNFTSHAKMEIMKGVIAIPAIYYGNGDIVFSHIINTLTPVNRSGYKIHRAPFMAQAVIKLANETTTTRVVGLLDGSRVSGEYSAELWNGYVLNQGIYKVGYRNYKYNYGAPPFAGMIWKDEVSGLQGGSPMFLKDPTNYYNGGFEVRFDRLPSNDIVRIYPFARGFEGAANETNSPFYSSMAKSNVSTGNQWGSEQQDIGIVIPEYYEDGGYNPYNLNLFVAKNNSNELMIINQRDRGVQTQNPASYGYYTNYIGDAPRRIDAEEPTKPVTDVTAEYLNNKYDLSNNSIQSWQNPIVGKLNMRNVRDDMKINFITRPDKITINAPKGEVTVNVYATARYDSGGKLQYTDDVQKLRQYWWASHYIGTVTFYGFKPVIQTLWTKGQYTANINSVDGMPASDWFIPAGMSIKGINNSYESKRWFNRMVAPRGKTGRVGDSPITGWKKEPNEFNSTKDSNKWFNDVFYSIDMVDYDNNAGTIKINPAIRSNFAYWDAESDKQRYVKYWERTVAGMRQIKDTSFKYNSEANVFTNPAWKNVNLPWIGTYSDGASVNVSETWPSNQGSVSLGTKIITEDEIKTWLFDTYIKSAYDSKDASNEWVKGVAYAEKYQELNGSNPANWPRLTKDNIRLSNFHFLPTKGMFWCDVRLNIFNDSKSKNNGNGGLRWTKSATIGNDKGQEEDGVAPYGRWYIGGFRTDNVTTHLANSNDTTWDLSNVLSSIPINSPWIQDASANRERAQWFFNQVYKFMVEQNKMIFPFWTRPRDFFDQHPISYTVKGVDYERGSLVLKFHLRKEVDWVEIDEGRVQSGCPQELEYNQFGPITITGFKPVQPLIVDAVGIYNLSTSTLTQDMFIGESVPPTQFNSWIDQMENEIIKYIREKDVAANGDGNGAQTLDQWKARLTFKYSLDSDADFTLNKSQIYGKIFELINAKPGKLGYLYAFGKNDGIKLRVHVIDTPPADGSAAPLQFSTTNPDQATENWALFDTTKIHTNISLQEWIVAMGKNKGTAINGGSEANNSFDSITPPRFDGSSAGTGLTYEQVQTFLVAAGYKFSYSWLDKDGQRHQTQNKLPSASTYNPADPIITVEIMYPTGGVIPPICIFGDPNTSSETFTLKLAVKKLITVDLDAFSSVGNVFAQKLQDKTINISSTGQTNNISDIIFAWTEAEKQLLDTFGENKQYLKVAYAINNSGYDYTSTTMWPEIIKGWQNATTDINQIGKLRFLSLVAQNGTKIEATIQFQRPEYGDDYKLDFLNGDNGSEHELVQHGINTTWDMSAIRDALTKAKTPVNPGATAEDLSAGFSPLDVMGVSFTEFENKVKTELGISFQWKAILPNSGLDDENGWSATRPLSADKTLNQIGIRATAQLAPQNGSNFGLANFANGFNDGDVANSYTSGVILTLALPEYIIVDLSQFETLKDQVGDKNITISSNGNATVNDVKEILNAWKAWEQTVLNGLGDKKNKVQIVYKVNSSAGFDYTSTTIWPQIQTAWQNAVTNMSDVGKLRFATEGFNDNGTKIEAMFRLADGVNEEEFRLTCINGTTDQPGGLKSVFVNTGIDTTWDLSDYTAILQSKKTNAGAGDQYDHITALTPPAWGNVTFDQFKQETENQLKMKFQWKSSIDGSNWQTNIPNSINGETNLVYLRASAQQDLIGGSQFNIKNFASSTTDITSQDEVQQWSDGVRLEVNLPKYIKVDVSQFSSSVNAVLNAKNINITSDGNFEDAAQKREVVQALQAWEQQTLDSFGANKDKLRIVYSVNGSDLVAADAGYDSNTLFDQIQKEWANAVLDMTQVGKLRFKSDVAPNGTVIEATVKLTQAAEATGEWKVQLLNDQNGKVELNTGINTTWDLSAYASILERGMTIVPEGEKQDNISDFTPPAWGNVLFKDFETNTKSQLGMKFQWHTSLDNGKDWSNNKPTAINPLDNNIWVRLSADKATTDTDSQFNIKGFKDPQPTDITQQGDSAWTSGVKLTVQLPKYIEINLDEKFANINTALNDKSITINATTGNTSQGMNETQQAWQTWEQQMMATFDPEAQSKIEVKYAINDSAFDYSLATLWVEITKAWQNAVTNPDKLGQLRFWSDAFANGLKVRATFVVKPEFAQGDNSYAISWAGAGKKSEIIVNHGIDTVLDLSDYASLLEANKIAAGPDSNAQQVNGFTMPGLNGMDFNTFKQAASQQLGMEFQWAASQQGGTWANWVSDQNLITSVDPASNQIKFRLKPGAAGLNNNSQFNIANFRTGTTDVDGNNQDNQWSSGVVLTLNLPKYIDVSNAVRAFAQDMAVNLVQANSNTKYIKFQDTVDAKIAELKNKIITDNNLAGKLTAAQIGVEFKFNALGSSSASGTTFSEFNSQTTADMISKSNTWNQFTNGIYVRVILLGPDSGEANHDDITTSYESDKKEYAIKVQSFQVLDNTYDSHTVGVNPILFWTDSVDAKLKTIVVKGKTTNKISLDLAAAGFVEDAGIWYTDDKKNLKLEFSTEALTEDQAGYDNTGANWTTTAPTSLPSTKNLFVRAVANYANVVYGPVYEQNAKAVKLDTSQIKPVINVNIKAAASQLVFAGTLTSGTNPSAAFTTLAADLEQKAIDKAFEGLADQSGKDKVEIKYVLRTSAQDTNTDWITFDDVVAKLTADLKKYNSTNFGIASFLQGQYSLLATVVSKDPEYNIQDSTIQDEDQAVEFAKNGVQLVTDQIVTKIDLSEWFKFLQDNKVPVANKAYRAIVDLSNKVLQPKTMPGSTSSGFLNGRTFNDIVALLKDTYGVEFEFSTNNTDWVDNITDLQNFDDTTNKLYMQVTPPTNNQIKLVRDAQDMDAPQTIEMNIQYPKSLKVDQQWIDDFINSNVVSGNTKFLTIEEAIEAELVQKIVDANPPIPGDPTPNVWVEYRLGTTGKWFKRQAFIDDLAKQTKDQTTNQIQFRLQVDNKTQDNEPIYSIDQTERDLTDGTIDANAAVKIYVNPNYEDIAENVSVKGTNTKFTYNYGSLPVKGGQWAGAAGLKIQWTIEKTATYDDVDNDPKWNDSQIEEINAKERYLAIRIIALDGYVYSATYNENGVTANAKIHLVNTDEIKSEVLVDMETLKQLQFEGYSDSINLEALKQSEQNVLAKVEQGLGEKLEIKYKVTLADGTQLKDTLMTADELQAALQEYASNYNNPSQGLIKFTVDGVQLPGATISATFVSKDPLFTPIDKNGGAEAVEQGMVVPTNNIKTKVNLKAWMEVLQTVPTKFAPGSTNENISGITPPAMTGAQGTGFLAGMDFNAIQTLLNSVGISIEFQAPGSTTQDNWVPLDQINNLKNATLNIRFVVNDPALVQSVEIIGTDGQPQDNANPTVIKLVINLPITIVVNMDYLNQLAFEGQTNDLTNFDAIKTKEQEIIENVKTDSKVGADQVTADKIDAAQIGIKYYLVGFPGTATISNGWMTLDEVKAAIDAANTEKVNFTSNAVQAKFVLLDNPIIDQETGAKQYQLSVDENATQVINPEQFDENATFKVYIHNVNPTTDPQGIFDTYKITGGQDSYQIANFDKWMEAINNLKGLEIEFNSVSKVGPDGVLLNEPDENSWSTEYNKNPIDNNRNYWVRFKVKPGFVFENALQNDPQYSDAIKLDASAVKVTMKVESAWLKEIQLTGNLKDLVINDATTLQKAQAEVPQGTDVNVIKIQYTYNGIDWMSKDELIAKLAELKGGPDGSGWIILRESIKARYVLNHEINDQLQPPLGLEIDGTPINNDEESPLIQLINDAEGLNVDVKGYINLDKLTPFIAENFWVTGTSNKAILHIKDAQVFNNLLDAYKSTGIFEILYKTEKDSQYEPTNKVWNPDGAGIQDQLNINGSLADKYFGIIFRSTSDKYEVYKGDQVQTNGYEITSESIPPIKVAVSIEVINPLIGATVSFNFLDGNKQAIYFQNNGAFKLTIEKDGTQYNSFEEFINALPTDGDWNQEMKDSLELAYYVADHELTPDEYTEATKVSNIQPSKGTPAPTDKYNVWKTLPILNDQTDLGLKVNDYVIVAIRIKDSSLVDPNDPNSSGYIIKDDNHTPTKATRAYGYKIKTEKLDINWAGMSVRNIGAPVNDEKGIDGFAYVDNLDVNVAADVQNYNGTFSLKLNYFNEFYRNAQDEILVSGSGDRLVKRQITNNKGNAPYLDAAGTPIRDKNGDEVYPYYEDSNGINILSKPVIEPISTRSHELTQIGGDNSNSFRFNIEDTWTENQLMEYALFANQEIKVQFGNKKGLAEAVDEYDYYVDTEKEVSYTLQTDKIKFILSNPQGIRYKFNTKEFKEQLKSLPLDQIFENAEDGKGKFKEDFIFNIMKSVQNSQDETVLDTAESMINTIKDDFEGQLKLQTSIRRTGASAFEPPLTAEIGPDGTIIGMFESIENLRNDDIIKIEIVPVSDDFIFLQKPDPLQFKPERLIVDNSALIDKLKWLRVEQTGEWNGKGGFRVLVDNPYDPSDDGETVESLSENEFEIRLRVWGPDQQMKSNGWISGSSINSIGDGNNNVGLSNGDKIEWAIFSSKGSTTKNPFYNTVSASLDVNQSGTPTYVQINRTGTVVGTSIPTGDPIYGPLPQDANAYPADLGFTIEGLKDTDDQGFTTITDLEFRRLIGELGLSFTGINGYGNMIAKKMPSEIIVNVEGSNTRIQYSLEYLIQKGYIKFYYAKGIEGLSANGWNEFNWNYEKDADGKLLLSPQCLSNGDYIKIEYQDTQTITPYAWTSQEVSGLSVKQTDSMPMIAWVGIGAASIVTLGIFAFIYFFARNRKLKNNK